MAATDHLAPGREAWSIRVRGTVQGVGFRFTVRHIAKGFDVTGWVRNLPDGRVELQVSGDAEELRAFLDQVAQSELHSLIREQTENKLNEPVAARGFERAGQNVALVRAAVLENPEHELGSFDGVDARDCAERGSVALLSTLRRLVKRAGRTKDIRITRTHCMGRCGEGPALVVYPDGIWYRGMTAGDAEELLSGHLLGDRLLEHRVDNIMQ